MQLVSSPDTWLLVALIRGTSCRLKLFEVFWFEPQVLLSDVPKWVFLVTRPFLAKIGVR